MIMTKISNVLKQSSWQTKDKVETPLDDEGDDEGYDDDDVQGGKDNDDNDDDDDDDDDNWNKYDNDRDIKCPERMC